MTNTIFFSWQSDLGETRGVIQAALDKALRNLNRDLALEEALRLDEDTSGVAGWPEITSTILDKIISGYDSDKTTPAPRSLYLVTISKS